ncbi:MAG TPA: amino acid adenylation domain-containing protein, partial [Herpetosiphonaceae bacterium]|nr:amino acid adenylation domain-containing protein [Herpetosiphonaceae bacterium]
PAPGAAPRGHPALPPLGLSYRDYVLATRAYATSAEPGALRAQAYWSARLPSLPPAPLLPLAKSPSALAQPRFVRRTGRLETQTWQHLKAQATRTGLTFNAILCAAYAEILAAWSKSAHFTLNTLFANRLPLHPDVDRIVGNFSTTLLLEVDNTEADSFEARARRLQAQLWSDLDHSVVSGISVVRDLARTQGWTSRAATPVVFTSMLNMTSGWQKQRLPGVQAETVYSCLQTPQVWLDHQVYEEDGALVFNWDAVEELFPDGMLDDMFAAYSRRLAALAGDAGTWHAEDTILVPAAQIDRRAAVNATGAPLPDGLLHTPFLTQVLRQPDHPAVIAPDRTLSYAELDRRAAAVAHWLRQHDARPNTLVAVVMHKGWEQVVAVLGVLSAGAAYLPLDPALPPERLQALLAHAECSLVLTQPELDAHLDWPAHVRRHCIDAAVVPDAGGASLAPCAQPTDLAYVIYTSGSTGLPKGVMIDHRGALNTICDLNQRFGVGPEDRVLALSALSFDLSVYDVFGTLAAGGTIVLPDARGSRDPAHWAALLAQHQITLWNSVPALMELLAGYIEQHPPRTPLPLRLILLSGDWIPIGLPARLQELLPQAQLTSLGGATEASIWSILYPITQVDPTWTSIPYGTPLRNQQWHVLDAALQPRPDWVPGELYIGGVGLAQGYWRDEEKTAARFITHPQTGERLYRTGDLGRYWPDGTIEFLGREDFQVKIQGYRIELGRSKRPSARWRGCARPW